MIKNKRKIFIAGGFILILAVIGIVMYNSSQQSAGPYAVAWSKVKNLLSEDQLQRLKSDYDRAMEKYKKDNNNFDALMTFGFVNYQVGDFQKAKEAYTKAGEISPNNYNSFWNLANTYVRLADYESAEGAYLKAVENGPEQARFYRALGDLYFYNLTEKKSQIPSLYKNGLEKIPGDYDLLVGLAQYYRDTGDKTNAIKYYREAMENYPDSKAALQEEINLLK